MIKHVFLSACAAALCLGSLAADSYEYLSGFGNEFSSEAVTGTLPIGQNSPQTCARGLYAEQLSGTSFTTPRALNRRTWLYRIQPSVCHTPFKRIAKGKLFSHFGDMPVTPNQILWKPLAIPQTKTDFIDGLVTIAGAGNPETKTGIAIHLYAANTSMEDRCLCNADGHMLMVPQQGTLDIRTECGMIEVTPGEICVIPRGMRFSIALKDENARGYVCESFGAQFQLPELGPIGANGLASARDFLTPVASYEKREADYRVVMKFAGELFEAKMDHSPFNVVAYHGNYVPYKYDLAKFCPMNTVSFDHADPSIFTVLTCPTNEAGVAALDFVIFPPRWLVAEHTFRPPYYHRNTMSEYMGIIKGSYEAKRDKFVAGGASLHSCMTPHGPDTKTFEHGSTEEMVPARVGDDALAFMFESTFVLRPTHEALRADFVDADYRHVWDGLSAQFDLENEQGVQ